MEDIKLANKMRTFQLDGVDALDAVIRDEINMNNQAIYEDIEHIDSITADDRIKERYDDIIVMLNSIKTEENAYADRLKSSLLDNDYKNALEIRAKMKILDQTRDQIIAQYTAMAVPPKIDPPAIDREGKSASEISAILQTREYNEWKKRMEY